MFDTNFYSMLADTDGYILRAHEYLNHLKDQISEIGHDRPEARGPIQNKVSEVYLNIVYVQTIRDRIGEFLDDVKLLSLAVERRIDYSTFNMLYEESKYGDGD